MAATKQKIIICIIRKICPLKPSYVAPVILYMSERRTAYNTNCCVYLTSNIGKYECFLLKELHSRYAFMVINDHLSEHIPLETKPCLILLYILALSRVIRNPVSAHANMHKQQM